MDDQDSQQIPPVTPNVPLQAPLNVPPIEEEPSSFAPSRTPVAPPTTSPFVSPLPSTPTVSPTMSEPFAMPPEEDRPFTSPNLSSLPPKPKRRGLFVGGIIAAVLVVLGGGSALAYNFWYQNPQKVVTDSIINAMTAQSVAYTGTLSATGDTNLKVTMTGANTLAASSFDATGTFTLGGKEYTVGGSLMADTKAGDFYFRVKDVDTLLKDVRSSIAPAEQGLFDQFVAKVNNQWIKVSASDLASVSADASKAQTCTSDAIKKVQNDKSYINEVGTIYQKQPFITIDKQLGSKDDSLGYSLSIDDAKVKAFDGDLKNTRVFKLFQTCDPSLSIDQSDSSTTSSSSSNDKVELWVDRWSHQITKLTVDSKQDSMTASFLLQPKFNDKTTIITTPKTSTSLKQLSKDITDLEQMRMSAPMTSTPGIDGVSSQL